MGENKIADDKINVLVAIPRAGFNPNSAVDNQIDMAHYLGNLEARSNFKFHMATIGRLFPAKAREEFAKYVLKLKLDYLFMIDADMICPPNLFEALYRHDVDIVAPLAFQRRHPYYPVIYKFRSGWDNVRKERFFSNDTVKNYPKNTLFECEAVGFGAVLIKKEVLEKMPEPRFMSTCPNGEDILFCYNAREQAGVKVYCDTSTEIIHLGDPKSIGEKEFEEANDMEEIRAVHGDCTKDMYAEVGG